MKLITGEYRSKVNPKAISGMIISLLANVWLNPLVFSMSDEDIEKKCQVILGMMAMLGVDVADMYPAVYNMNKQINEMDNRK